MIDYSSTFSIEPFEKCPFCGADCHADFVDNGFGPYSVQCGPYFCEECGASEMGPEASKDGFQAAVTPEEWEIGWYKGGQVSPYANTVNGVLVDHVTAKAAYELGLLDTKPVTVEANGLSLMLLPGEDPAAVLAEAEAVTAEKDACPGLGLEPAAVWTPVSEADSMEADLVALRCGLVRPYAYMDAATAEAIEDERIGADICEQPYSW